MKHLALALSLFLYCGLAGAQHSAAHNAHPPVTLVTGYGDWHHAVTTSNAQAQKFFDQGFRYIYAFNHEEAARSFGRAAELDPKMAMAYWGTAEAIGPNYNDPADSERFKQAHEAIQKLRTSRRERQPANRRTLPPWPNAFPPVPTPTAAWRRKNIATPCARW